MTNKKKNEGLNSKTVESIQHAFQGVKVQLSVFKSVLDAAIPLKENPLPVQELFAKDGMCGEYPISPLKQPAWLRKRKEGTALNISEYHIVYIKSSGNYLNLYWLQDDSLNHTQVILTFKEAMQHLKLFGLVPIDRGTAVNRSYVESYSNATIILKKECFVNGKKLGLSVSRLCQPFWDFFSKIAK
jgi:hypothetical protein